MDEVSVLPWPICDPPIHRGTSDMGLSQGDTNCSASCLPPMRGVWIAAGMG